MTEQLLETWRIHARINLYILEAIVPEAFTAAEPTKGRSFVQMFAHIHNVRLLWLQSAAPELLTGLQKIEKDDPVTREALHTALNASSGAIASLLQKAMAAGGKVKGFKPHATAFVGYLIAHEAYHHGEIGVALTQIGHPLDRKTAFGMWEWGVR
jgi:uncharacterized damage-inducible protein DinB